MWVFDFQIFLVLFSASCLHYLSAATCEDIQTSHVKLDLAKQSINIAKSFFPKCRDETDESNCTAKDRSLAYLNTASDLISGANITCHASSCFQSLNATTCEETETSHVKLDLAKQSIRSAKSYYPKCREESEDLNCTVKDRFAAYLNVALELIAEANMTCDTCPETKVIVEQGRPIDCSDVQNTISNSSGVYRIWPRMNGVHSNESFEVYCDMKTDGGGWTVIQRRGNFAIRTDFFQDWETYKHGFGDITQEFWLGNDKIYSLTNQGNYSARFDLTDTQGEYRYSVYKTFSIADEKSSYRLKIKDHSGDANGDLESTFDGCKFSTKDRKNDMRGGGQECAKLYHSAFWFNPTCGTTNLNGIYVPGEINQSSVFWKRWKNSSECLFSVEIKLRRQTSSS